MFTWTQRLPAFVAVVLCFATLSAAVLIAQNGYGDNLDNYRMLRSWQQMVLYGLYEPSRFQGNLPSELILGFSASQLGPLGTSLISGFAGASSLFLSWRILARFVSPRTAAWALLPVAVNPYWVMASCTAMDYVHPLPFFLLGVLMLLERRVLVAVIALGLAAGIRISFLPLGLLTLGFAYAYDREQRKLLVEALLAFVVITGLIYVPAWISAHLGFSFLSSDRPTAQGFAGMLGRFAYKSVYLYGLPGAAIIACIVLWRGRARAGSVDDEERRLTVAALTLIAFHLLLFLYIPARVQYLMPAMLGFAALCAVWRVHRVALLGLAVAQCCYWFVSIDLLQIDHAANNPCDGVKATSARFSPHLGPGVLSPLWHGGETYESLPCFRAVLLEPPTEIHAPLPSARLSVSTR